MLEIRHLFDEQLCPFAKHVLMHFTYAGKDSFGVVSFKQEKGILSKRRAHSRCTGFAPASFSSASIASIPQTFATT